MVCKETSIAKKIINHFPDENIVLNKTINGRKPDIWFKAFNFTVKVDEGDYEDYGKVDEKEREDMLKRHNFKNF